MFSPWSIRKDGIIRKQFEKNPQNRLNPSNIYWSSFVRGSYITLIELFNSLKHFYVIAGNPAWRDDEAISIKININLIVSPNLFRDLIDGGAV